MEGLNFLPILIPLLALLAGWAIGFFDSNLRTAQKIKQAEEQARAAIQQAEQRLEEEREKLASLPAASPDDPGLLRLKNDNGSLTLELDGVPVQPSTLTLEQRKRLIELLNRIRPWLEGKTTPPPPSAPQPAAPAPAVPPPQAAPSPAPAAAAVKPAPAAPSTNKIKPPSTSIVEQINEILQARIQGTSLASRGVVLLESVTGGVLVYIGVNKYEGIDEVPDEAVKSAIRAAIAEWERRYTPGL
jgi:hypothetical protein